MSKDELKDLPPEERIKKLKELEKKKKKEIAEAQKLLQDSQKEISDREDWQRKVPIPQVASEEAITLSAAEKEVLITHKDIKEKKVKKEKQTAKKEELSLEDTVFMEKAELPPELLASDYAAKLSQEPMQNLYQEMSSIYKSAEEQGYMSPEQQRKADYISAATEKKLEDIEAVILTLSENVPFDVVVTRNLAFCLLSNIGEGGFSDVYESSSISLIPQQLDGSYLSPSKTEKFALKKSKQKKDLKRSKR